jgi:hypothetical protein
MAKRKTQGASILTGISTLFITAKSISKALDLFGTKKRSRNARLAYLRAKYNDEGMVQALMNGQFWQGQTSGQLKDALGYPHAIDDVQLKSRKREIWKYRPIGVNRYSLRITLDDDLVACWVEKN